MKAPVEPRMITCKNDHTIRHKTAKDALRMVCHSSKENRSIERNHHLEQYKESIRQLLTSEEGIKKRKQRSVEVEPVFDHLKHCNGFKRFTLRGIEKVELEFGLHALAHNLRKKVPKKEQLFTFLKHQTQNHPKKKSASIGY